MSEDSGQRIGAYGGIGFVVCAVVAAFIPGQPPAFDDSVSKIQSYFADRHTALNLSNLLTAVALILVFAFLGALRVRIARAEGEGGYLAQVFYGAGMVTIAVVMVGAFLTVAMTQRIAGLQDDGVVRAGFEITYLLAFGGAAFTSAVMLAAASTVILRTGMLAGWIGWLGMLGAAVNLVGGGAIMIQDTSGLTFLGLIGFLLFALWTVSICVVTLMGRSPARSTAGGVTAPA
jgi:hypothetical protein